MRHAAVLFAVLLFTIRAAEAQIDPKVEFEVVSIKPSPPTDGRGYSVYCNGGPGSKDPTMYNCVNMSLSNLITNAYKINYYQLSAGLGREHPIRYPRTCSRRHHQGSVPADAAADAGRAFQAGGSSRNP